MATKSKAEESSPLAQAVGGIVGFILGFVAFQLFLLIFNAFPASSNPAVGLTEVVVVTLIYVGIMTLILRDSIAEGGKNTLKMVFGFCGLIIVLGLVDYWILKLRRNRSGEPTAFISTIATIVVTAILIFLIIGVLLAARF